MPSGGRNTASAPRSNSREISPSPRVAAQTARVNRSGTDFSLEVRAGDFERGVALLADNESGSARKRIQSC